MAIQNFIMHYCMKWGFCGHVLGELQDQCAGQEHLKWQRHIVMCLHASQFWFKTDLKKIIKNYSFISSVLQHEQEKMNWMKKRWTADYKTLNSDRATREVVMKKFHTAPIPHSQQGPCLINRVYLKITLWGLKTRQDGQKFVDTLYHFYPGFQKTFWLIIFFITTYPVIFSSL